MFARVGHLSAAAVVAVSVVALTAGAAQAVTYGFRDITSAKPHAKGNGLSAGVVPSGNDLYNLSESGPLPSYIGKVYFGDSAGEPGHAGNSGPGKGNSGAGNKGGDPAATAAKSAGEPVSAASGTTHGHGAGGPGVTGKGIGLGAAPQFASASGGGSPFGDSLPAIGSGTPGAGLDGKALGIDASSDWSADGVSTVPLPASVLFLISALGGLWFVGARRRSYRSRR